MREALTELLQEVRAAGVPISIAESIDALRAAAAVGVEREPLREALAASIVKDEADRATFDEVFDRFFTSGEPARRKHREPRSGGEGVGRAGEEGRAPRPKPPPKPKEDRAERPALARKESPHPAVRKRERRRSLLRTPFRELTPQEAEELTALGEELGRRFRARLARRYRVGRRGRLDFRRTLRRSIAHGGAAFDLVLRRRRPGRPDLVALCDLSGSVRHAAELFAAVLAPSRRYFRRVRLFAFVDRAVEASVEAGRLVPHEVIDFHAFSDYGRMLCELEAESEAAFTRSSVLVVLGDARTNRRPPRADALRRLRARVRTLWWLVPEARQRWTTGDSALAAYAPICDEVLECSTAAELVAALERLV